MLKQFFPALVWSVAILLLSIFPGRNLPKVGWQFFVQLDKIAHIGIYFILALAIGWSLREQKELSWQKILLLISFCGLYGFLMEALQYWFLSDRSFEFHDIIANIIGSILGGAVVYLLFNKMKRQ